MNWNLWPTFSMPLICEKSLPSYANILDCGRRVILYNQSRLSDGWTNSLQRLASSQLISVLSPTICLSGFFLLIEGHRGAPGERPKGNRQAKAPRLALREGASDPGFHFLILHPALSFDEIGDDRDVKVLTLIGQVGPV